jgi:hypothetical protein
MFSTNSRFAISSRSADPRRKAWARTPLFMRRLRPVMMLSRTLMPLNKARFWKVRAMPISAARREFILENRTPERAISPFWGVYTPLITFSMELFPAPLGPMMARISCSLTSNEISVSAFTPPKASEIFFKSRIVSPIRCSRAPGFITQPSSCCLDKS